VREVREETGLIIDANMLLKIGSFPNYYRKFTLLDGRQVVYFEPNEPGYEELLNAGVKSIVPFQQSIVLNQVESIFFNQEICHFFQLQCDTYLWKKAVNSPVKKIVKDLESFRMEICSKRHHFDTYYILDKFSILDKVIR